MRKFDFKCTKCAHEFESVVIDGVDILCPECISNDVHKIYTPTPVIFKGKGFYTTDK